MRVPVGGSGPLLASVIGHGVLLSALAIGLGSAPPTPGSRPPRAVHVSAAWTESVLEEPPANPALPPTPRLRPLSVPEVRVPDMRPHFVVEDDAVLEKLPPRGGPTQVTLDLGPSLEAARLRTKPQVETAVPDRRADPPPAHPTTRERTEVPPRLRPLRTPRYYPALAYQRGLEGTVQVEILVTVEGRVREARLVVSSGHDLLDRAALASARSWLFAPIARARRAIIPFFYEL